jgi:hypothetical protein
MTEPRPQVDDAMELEAATIVAAKIGNGATPESIAEHYQYLMDGYELAKRLDRYEGWDTTREEMESLDEMGYLVSSALSKAEKEWFERTNPQPPLEVGTVIRLRDGIGAITGIYKYGPAKYLVKPDGQDDATSGQRRIIINFEDAKAA